MNLLTIKKSYQYYGIKAAHIMQYAPLDATTSVDMQEPAKKTRRKIHTF